MTPNHSFNSRFLFWASDRFPIFNAIVAFTMAFSIKGLFLTEGQFAWEYQDFLLGLAFLAHLFILRVMDEFKDFESDKIFHPNRAVQKGIITLLELKRLGFSAAIVQLASIGMIAKQAPVVFLVWLFVWLWSFLMMKEFFIKEFLRKKLLFYSVLHLLISPFMFLTGWLYYSTLQNDQDYFKLFLLLTLSFSTGLMFEFARKNRSVEEDKKGEISFSLIWGRSLTSIVIFFVTLIALYMGYLYLVISNANVMIYLPFAILTLAYSVSCLKKFTTEPTEKNHKKARASVELNVVWSFLGSFLIVLLSSYL